MRRVACLYAPALPLQAVLRAEPALAGAALAVTLDEDPRAPVVALSASARAAGVRSGMTMTQAAAAHGALVVRACSDAALRSSSDALVDVARAFAVRVERAARDLVLLEVGDLRRLYPREAGLAAALDASARKVALSVHVGIAGSKSVARLAATRAGTTVVAPGAERAFLAALPVSAAAPSEELRRALGRFGLHTLGAVAALPEALLGRRLGREGAWLARLARAEEDEPLRADAAPEIFAEGLDLEYELDSNEPLSFLVLGALGRLCARLEVRGLACAGLTLTLRLAPRGAEARDVAVAAPTTEAKVLTALVRLALDERPPPAAVRGFAVSARTAPAAHEQLPLFGPVPPAPDRLAATVAKLAALCGVERVGAPALADSHRPEAEALGSFRPPPAPGAPAAGPVPRALALRRIHPPRAIRVRLSPRGRPAALDDEPLSRAAGPWRVGGEWWSSRPFARDYYDVETRGGTLYRVYRDRTSERWFADGVYD